MRHIIGRSEPDVIIGSDKDRNRGCNKMEVRSDDHGHARDESSCSGLVHVRAGCV